ncbi:MAG: hypothetical protein ACXW31_05265 [Thermoanaerobaculia bacterium]
MSDYPTSRDVVSFLNERFASRGLPYRLEHIAVLPYMNPMWMANWDVPQLADAIAREGVSSETREIIEEELREARWQYPQVLEEF